MHLAHAATTAALLLAATSAVHAQTRSWTGGPEDTDFGDVDNWTITLPHENTIAIIGGSVPAKNSSVDLDKDRTLGGLVLTDGMNLNTNTSRLTIDDLNGTGVIVSGLNILPNNSLRPTTLTVENKFGYSDLHVIGGSTQVKNGGQLAFKNGGSLLADGGAIVVDSTSTISGEGSIVTIMPGMTSINNNGTIWANSIKGALHLNGLAANQGGFVGGKYDLDGSNETGSLRVSQDSQLVIVAELSDSFDGNIFVAKGGELSIKPIAPLTTAFVLGTSSDANVTLNGTVDKPAILSVNKDTFAGTHTTLSINGHGRIQGSADNVRNFFATGDNRIDIVDGGSLVFEHKVTTVNSGEWVVGDEAVLDFQDTLASAKSTQVILSGGRITGAGPGIFRNNNPSGIRGNGRFELPTSNDTSISADGGELVIQGGFGKVDWDGVNNIGQLNAVTGDLRLVDSNLDNAPDFNGTIRVGNGKTLLFDNFGFDLGSASRVQLTGGLVDQNLWTRVRVSGEIEVFEPSTWALRSAFENTANIKLGEDLRIFQVASFYKGASFTGNGKLIFDSYFMNLHDGTSFDVDVVNQSVLDLVSGAEAGVASINGNMDHMGHVYIRLFGDTLDLYQQLLVSETLTVRGGSFHVFLGEDFIPNVGDEFDILDFASFVDEGYWLNLPTLADGLAWDTSDFTTLGAIRIAAVPEPSSIILMVMSGAVVCRRRHA